MPKRPINSHFRSPRTREQVEADHAHLCAQLGNATFTYLELQKRLQATMEALSAEWKVSVPLEVKSAPEGNVVPLKPTQETE